MSFEFDQKMDRYEIISLLSEDSLWKTYQAHDPKFDRTVQVYLFHKEQVITEEFKQALGTMMNWRHVGLARLYDIGEFQGQNFIVQEYIPGQYYKTLYQPGKYYLHESFHLTTVYNCSLVPGQICLSFRK